MSLQSKVLHQKRRRMSRCSQRRKCRLKVRSFCQDMRLNSILSASETHSLFQGVALCLYETNHAVCFLLIIIWADWTGVFLSGTFNLMLICCIKKDGCRPARPYAGQLYVCVSVLLCHLPFLPAPTSAPCWDSDHAPGRCQEMASH